MAEFVKDTIHNNEFHDLVLLHLIELTVSAVRSGRPLFPSLMQEPVFFRKHFQVWVSEALDEVDRMQASGRESVFE